MIALVLLLATLLPSCSAGLEAPVVTEPPKKTTTEKKTEEKKEEKETEPEPILQDYDPAEDDVVNILLIGNSFTYYYVEELYGIAKTAGIKMKVCNVYYSGCSLKQHWTWLNSNEPKYQYFETDGSGRSKYESYTLKMCLRQENWDVIGFLGGAKSYAGDLQKAKDSNYKYITGLLEYVQEQFPMSKLYFQEVWAYQVGYDRSGFKVETAEFQAELARWNHEFAVAVCNDFPMTRVPCGTAWQYARQDSRVGDKLCNRGKKSDNYHEGEEGGGQYLNACVWFEVLTGQSCIGNTWRPDTYALSESQITGLQQAAHRAVAESRG